MEVINATKAFKREGVIIQTQSEIFDRVSTLLFSLLGSGTGGVAFTGSATDAILKAKWITSTKIGFAKLGTVLTAILSPTASGYLIGLGIFFLIIFCIIYGIDHKFQKRSSKLNKIVEVLQKVVAGCSGIIIGANIGTTVGVAAGATYGVGAGVTLGIVSGIGILIVGYFIILRIHNMLQGIYKKSKLLIRRVSSGTSVESAGGGFSMYGGNIERLSQNVDEIITRLKSTEGMEEPLSIFAMLEEEINSPDDLIHLCKRLLDSAILNANGIKELCNTEIFQNVFLQCKSEVLDCAFVINKHAEINTSLLSQDDLSQRGLMTRGGYIKKRRKTRKRTKRRKTKKRKTKKRKSRKRTTRR